MQHSQRKSAPGVRRGKVQKKNRTALSPDIYEAAGDGLEVRRERPIKDFYHAVAVADVRRWIRRIPDWGSVSVRLRGIILTPGDDWCYGRYNNAGVLTLDAWPRYDPTHISGRKQWLADQIGCVRHDPESAFVYMSRKQVRAFLLLGTFLHELGHHIDRMNTRTQADAANGEPFAIAYEVRRQRELWDAYVAEFGDPSLDKV